MLYITIFLIIFFLKPSAKFLRTYGTPSTYGHTLLLILYIAIMLYITAFSDNKKPSEKFLRTYGTHCIYGHTLLLMLYIVINVIYCYFF